MKSVVIAGAAALALFGSACSAQTEQPAPSPSPSVSSHSASPGLAPEHVRSVPDDCATEAAKAPGKYEKYREEVLAAVRSGTPAVDAPPGASYGRATSKAATVMSILGDCSLDGLSQAWGVDVRGWLSKGSK
ncbi:hypothetical protein [Mycobacteroides abscessus]|uniref:hypothetical protein n=1 Tax=Mycobacteroides abscessus TaxID=36809 RepID=UPI001F326206|nr:hypothetical protein [Mycobacteroides abscessus]